MPHSLLLLIYFENLIRHFDWKMGSLHSITLLGYGGCVFLFGARISTKFSVYFCIRNKLAIKRTVCYLCCQSWSHYWRYHRHHRHRHRLHTVVRLMLMRLCYFKPSNSKTLRSLLNASSRNIFSASINSHFLHGISQCDKMFCLVLSDSDDELFFYLKYDWANGWWVAKCQQPNASCSDRDADAYALNTAQRTHRINDGSDKKK